MRTVCLSIITVLGCDSGFGQNLAIRLDSMGFKVYAGCLTINGDGAQHLRNICSDRLILVPLDVTKNEEISAATQLVLSTLEDRSRLLQKQCRQTILTY